MGGGGLPLALHGVSLVEQQEEVRVVRVRTRGLAARGDLGHELEVAQGLLLAVDGVGQQALVVLVEGRQFQGRAQVRVGLGLILLLQVELGQFELGFVGAGVDVLDFREHVGQVFLLALFLHQGDQAIAYGLVLGAQV